MYGIFFLHVERQPLVNPFPNAGPEFIVNTYRAQWQSDPDVAVLADGSFVIVWRSFFSEDAGSVYYIGGQRFAADGTRLGNELILSNTSREAEYPRIDPLPDGGYAVVYEAAPETILGQSDIYFRTFDADGTPRIQARQISPNVDDWFFSSEVLALSNGNSVVFYSGDVDGDVGEGIVAQVVNGQGAPVGARYLVNQTTFADQHSARAVELTNGNSVVIWDSELTTINEVGNPVDDARGRILGPDGRPIGNEFRITNDNDGVNGGIYLTQTDLDVAALPDGRFVATWYETNIVTDPTSFEIRGRIFGPNGGPQSPIFKVNTTDGRVVNNSSVVALEGGGFVVVYDVTTNFDDLDDVYGQFFSDSGQRIGTEFHVAQVRSNVQEEAQIDALQNGGFVVTWMSEFTDGDNDGISARVFGPPDVGDLVLNGTNGNDRLVGQTGNDLLQGLPGNDTLIGNAGNDTLNGGGGSDNINGGAGNDLIIGGPGSVDLRDTIFAGAGNDTVDGGAGNDLIYGQDGNDVIEGGAGVDEVIGQAGNDVLTGSGFSDLIFGGAGDDFINGGFGFDRVNGGAGADRFFHVGVQGHGSDWIQDFAEEDKLVFGGAASIDQFQVNTALTGGAGDAAVAEAFVIYRPTGQILWALVDGASQDALTLRIGAQEFDLMI